MSERIRERASISYIAVHPEEGSFGGYESAKIDCPRCEDAGGWTGADSGLYCPFGCGVRLVSTRVEDDERYRRESDAREAVRRDERAARRGKRP